MDNRLRLDHFMWSYGATFTRRFRLSVAFPSQPKQSGWGAPKTGHADPEILQFGTFDFSEYWTVT